MEPQPLDILPWLYPFRMLDRMVELDPHRKVVTVKRISAGDPVVAGDGAGGVGFFPSVLVLEALSQSAALLFRLSYGADAAAGSPMLGHLKASFTGAAAPGDTLELTVIAIKMTTRGGIFSGAARVEGVVIAEAELGFGVASS